MQRVIFLNWFVGNNELSLSAFHCSPSKLSTNDLSHIPLSSGIPTYLLYCLPFPGPQYTKSIHPTCGCSLGSSEAQSHTEVSGYLPQGSSTRHKRIKCALNNNAYRVKGVQKLVLPCLSPPNIGVAGGLDASFQVT